MEPLWARVDRNRAKLATFVVLFVGGSAFLLATALVAVPGTLIGVAGWSIEALDPAAYARGLALAFGSAVLALLLLGSLAAAVQLANAEDWVRNRFVGSDLVPGSEPNLERVVHEMSLAAGLAAPPHLLVLDAATVNACAIGATRRRPVIGVTRGLLSELDENEQRAVVATLMARIAAGDILFGTALAALMGPLKAIRDAKDGKGPVAGACSWGADGCVSDGCAGDGCGGVFDGVTDSDSAEGCLAAIGFAVFAAVVIAITWVAVTVAAWLVTAWGRALHRTSYEKADAEGMLLLKDPSPMLSALRCAVTSANEVADGDPSYDGIFYVSTSGTPRVEKLERRRYDRLREVLGVDGAAASL